MKAKNVAVTISLARILSIMTALILLQGCVEPSGNGGKITNPPPEGRPLWKNIKVVENPRNPELGQESGDITLDGFGEIVGLRPLQEEDREVLAMDWQDEILGFYTLNLNSCKATKMGGIQLEGPRPQLESYAWPWVLLQSKDDDGNHSWLLADISSGTVEIAWESFTWVPQGLQRRPVWFDGKETWYLGPASGPVITDVLSGKTFTSDYVSFNPVSNSWPRWAGGISRSPWYAFPVVGGGSSLLNLENGRQILLEQDEQLVWNFDRTLIAWTQNNKLGLVDTFGKVTSLDIGDFVPGTLMWSSNGNNLYFIGGQQDYFGTTWKGLWFWNRFGANQLFAFPGNWARWRLMAATDEAVLAVAGDNSDHLVYYDIANEKVYEFNATEQWQWQDGTLVALRNSELVRISPGFDVRVLVREAEGITLLGIVNQFVFYIQGGKVFIKQLIM